MYMENSIIYHDNRLSELFKRLSISEGEGVGNICAIKIALDRISQAMSEVPAHLDSLYIIKRYRTQLAEKEYMLDVRAEQEIQKASELFIELTEKFDSTVLAGGRLPSSLYYDISNARSYIMNLFVLFPSVKAKTLKGAAAQKLFKALDHDNMRRRSMAAADLLYRSMHPKAEAVADTADADVPARPVAKRPKITFYEQTVAAMARQLMLRFRHMAAAAVMTR